MIVDLDYKYLTFNDLKDIKSSNTQLYYEASSETLLSCPDIYDSFPCYFYLVDKANSTVCSVKAFPDTFFDGKRRYKWAWLGALVTREEYRGKGVASLLTKECEKTLHEHDIAWGGVFSNDIALRIYRKLGFTIPGYAGRYILLKSIKPLIKSYLNIKGIDTIINLPYMIIIKAFKKAYIDKFFNTGKRVEIQECKDLKEIEELIKREKTNKFTFNRSMVKILWKIDSCNRNKNNLCKLYLCKEIESKKIVAYFIVRYKKQTEAIGVRYKDFSIYTLMDFGIFIENSNIYKIISGEVFKLFWETKADVFEVISNSAQLIRTLRKLGLIRVGKGMSFKFSMPKNWQIDEYNASRLSNWGLNYFCGDGFSF